jgi:predicted nucleic acid-binding protein
MAVIAAVALSARSSHEGPPFYPTCALRRKRRRARAQLRSFPDEPLRRPDCEAAAHSGNACRAKGITPSLVDVLICRIAIDRRWHISATDPDFVTYARVPPIQQIHDVSS